MKASDKTGEGQGEGQDTIKNLYDLLVTGIKSIYYTEKELTNVLPKMEEKATSDKLQTALLKHIAETQTHVKRVEEVFLEMEHEPEAKKCETITSLIKDGEEIISRAEQGNVRDAAIILIGQKIEHFEIATYGALISYARIVGEDAVAQYLQTILDEEKAADENLTDVSKFINVDADTSKVNTSTKIAY